MSHKLGWPPFCDPIWCDWVLCPCGARFQRPADEAYTDCLSCRTAERLTAEGVRPDDPALAAIAAYNAEAQRKAGVLSDEELAEPGRAGAA
jgi:hypothetical protein